MPSVVVVVVVVVVGRVVVVVVGLPEDRRVHFCGSPPQQSYNCTFVPSVLDPFGTSTHRPDPSPTIELFEPRENRWLASPWQA